MGATLPQQITRVIIPASVPTVFTGLRLGGALTIIGVVVSEMLTSAAGIGYLVTLNRTILDSPRVFAAILMILILSVAYYLLARAIESRFIVWQSAARKGARRRRPHRGRPRVGGAPVLLKGVPMPLPTHLLPTTVVGSYPQPDWLVNREMLSKVVPRTRMSEIWRIPEAYLEQAQDDATVLAIRDRSAPASTSSPTARSAAKATPTASPPRSRASTWTTPAR